MEVEGRCLWAVDHWSKARRLKLQGIRGQHGPGKGQVECSRCPIVGVGGLALCGSLAVNSTASRELWEDSGQLRPLEAGGLGPAAQHGGWGGGWAQNLGEQQEWAEVPGWGPGWLLEGLLLVFSCSGCV